MLSVLKQTFLQLKGKDDDDVWVFLQLWKLLALWTFRKETVKSYFSHSSLFHLSFNNAQQWTYVQMLSFVSSSGSDLVSFHISNGMLCLLAFCEGNDTFEFCLKLNDC